MDKLRAAMPTVAKKYVWNVKYGLLGYPQLVAPEDIVRYLSARLSKISTLVDLGCGRGSLLRALREKGWQGSYCGVDISKNAIADAKKIGDQRSSWTVSDFESFRSPFKWDIVAMVESVCYVKLADLPEFLGRVVGMLNPEGALLFRLHDLGKHREYVESILALYPRTEKVDQNLFCVPSSTQAIHQKSAS